MMTKKEKNTLALESYDIYNMELSQRIFLRFRDRLRMEKITSIFITLPRI